MRRAGTVILGLVMVSITWPRPALAHRLDEYLQATRIGVTRDRVEIEVDLTPGAAIASSVVASIDADSDGRVSDAERDGYARDVLRALTLAIDDKGASLTLTASDVAPVNDLLGGTGALRFRAAADLPTISAGHHVLTFSNGHQPQGSVYLVNALQPSDPGITIRAQRRDPIQREIAIDYDVAYGAWTRTLALLGGFVVVGAIAIVRRRRGR